MRCNVGGIERAIRLVLGIGLLVLAVSPDLPLEDTGVFYFFGVLALVTGALGYCPAWKLLGINTTRALKASGRKMIVGMVLSVVMASFSALTMAAEKDIMTPRVSPKEIEIARALKNPLPQTSKTIALGKKVYRGKGSCVLCHGVDGRGTGMGAPSLEPSPRNFHRAGFWRHRTDGELFWTIKNGSFGTGMVAYGGFLTDKEIWAVITYEHTFADGMEDGSEVGNKGVGPDMMRPHQGGCCQVPELSPKLERKP
jgi:mono/diheme cytochrome c family protein